VLGAINCVAGAVLRAIDLRVLLRRQLAAVGRPIRMNPLIDALFAIFEPRGLTSRQLAVADPIRDPILLIFAALPDLIVAVVGSGGIMFVGIDVVAQPVLLRVDLLVLGLRQLSSVGLTVVTNLAIEIGFPAFERLGFAGGQLPRVDTVGDPVLLIFTTVVDGRRIGRLGEPTDVNIKLATITRFVFIMSSRNCLAPCPGASTEIEP
jgi:hypothetical protein